MMPTRRLSIGLHLADVTDLDLAADCDHRVRIDRDDHCHHKARVRRAVRI
jgi:hypothetical protein